MEERDEKKMRLVGWLWLGVAVGRSIKSHPKGFFSFASSLHHNITTSQHHNMTISQHDNWGPAR